jgi:hypothetical protein
MRPNTRAVSLIDSLCPICEPTGPDSNIGALVVRCNFKSTTGTGRGFLEYQAIFLPSSICSSSPLFLLSSIWLKGLAGIVFLPGKIE